jgi:hypothetical protein
VEDALKEAMIPHMHCARPLTKEGGKGKGKGKAQLATPEPVAAAADEVSVCRNSGGKVMSLLCFCCPMMEFTHYQQLYVEKEFMSANAPKTSDDKV